MPTTRFKAVSFHPDVVEVVVTEPFRMNVRIARFTGPHALPAALGLIDQFERAVDTWVESFEGAERL